MQSLPNHSTARSPLSAKRGAAALEMALALPVLLVMLFGLLELGHMYFVKATVSKAAESGARYAVTGRGEVEGTRLADIKSAARELADALGSDKVQIAVRSYENYDMQGEIHENDAGNPCQMVEVEVRCSYDAMTPFLSEALPDDMTFVAKERMVNEPWMPCD